MKSLHSDEVGLFDCKEEFISILRCPDGLGVNEMRVYITFREGDLFQVSICQICH